MVCEPGLVGVLATVIKLKLVLFTTEAIIVLGYSLFEFEVNSWVCGCGHNYFWVAVEVFER